MADGPGYVLFHVFDFELILLRFISSCCCVFASALITAHVMAATPAVQGCRLKPTTTGAVTRVIDNQTVRLSDRTVVHLAGIIAPTALDSLSETTSWPPEQSALRALEDLVRDRNVGIALTGPHRDRYGRLAGHVFAGTAAPQSWVQAELVARGAVRVDAASLDVGCTRLLLALEDRARHAGAGLWAHAAYRIRDAKRPRRLLRYRSTYQIVEGRVRKVAHVRKRIYINFDKNWRTDFTIGLTERTARRLGLIKAHLTALEGHRIRTRGWIERRGGPFIYLRALGQIEVLDGPPLRPRLQRPPGDSRAAPGKRRHQPPSDTGRKQNRPAVSRPGGLDL